MPLNGNHRQERVVLGKRSVGISAVRVFGVSKTGAVGADSIWDIDSADFARALFEPPYLAAGPGGMQANTALWTFKRSATRSSPPPVWCTARRCDARPAAAPGRDCPPDLISVAQTGPARRFGRGPGTSGGFQPLPELSAWRNHHRGAGVGRISCAALWNSKRDSAGPVFCWSGYRPKLDRF